MQKLEKTLENTKELIQIASNHNKQTNLKTPELGFLLANDYKPIIQNSSNIYVDQTNPINIALITYSPQAYLKHIEPQFPNNHSQFDKLTFMYVSMKRKNSSSSYTQFIQNFFSEDQKSGSLGCWGLVSLHPHLNKKSLTHINIPTIGFIGKGIHTTHTPNKLNGQKITWLIIYKLYN